MMTGEAKARTKGTILALLAAVLGAAYLVYIVKYFYGGFLNTGNDSAEALGAGIASMLVTPHIACVGCAVIFNVLGLFIKKLPGFLLTAGILYLVGGVVFIMYFLFVVLQAVFCFIAFARRKKSRSKD